MSFREQDIGRTIKLTVLNPDLTQWWGKMKNNTYIGKLFKDKDKYYIGNQSWAEFEGFCLTTHSQVWDRIEFL